MKYLPLKIQDEQAFSMVTRTLSKKRHFNYIIKEVELILVPCYLVKTIDENMMNILVDAYTGEIYSQLGDLLTNPDVKFKDEFFCEDEYTTLEPRIEKDKLEEYLKKLLNKDDLEIVGIILIYYPFWYIKIDIDGKIYYAKVDGYFGILYENIPERTLHTPIQEQEPLIRENHEPFDYSEIVKYIKNKIKNKNFDNLDYLIFFGLFLIIALFFYLVCLILTS